MISYSNIICLGTKQRSAMAPGGTRRSTISYDAKTAVATPPVIDPTRCILNIHCIKYINFRTLICKLTINYYFLVLLNISLTVINIRLLKYEHFIIFVHLFYSLVVVR